MGKWYYNEKIQYKDTSMQSVFILGRLGKDPETKRVGSGQVTKFSVATGFKKADGTEHTDWHQIEAWNKTSELAQKYLHKGDKVALRGEIRYSKKDDKYFTCIIADKIEFLSSKQDRETVSASTPITPDNLDAELDDLF